MTNINRRTFDPCSNVQRSYVDKKKLAQFSILIQYADQQYMNKGYKARYRDDHNAAGEKLGEVESILQGGGFISHSDLTYVGCFLKIRL